MKPMFSRDWQQGYIHYAMGAASGAIYGALAELSPAVTSGAEIPYGMAVWLVADEVAVPALGLSKAPTEYPLSTHAYALASHIVYGVTKEAVRRALRSRLGLMEIVRGGGGDLKRQWLNAVCFY